MKNRTFTLLESLSIFMLSTLIMLITLPCAAQVNRSSIETFSNNTQTGDSKPRYMQYIPCDGGFFSSTEIKGSGKNRYTRALYGSNTEYRIETSDVPIFALYKAKNYKNIRFYIDGKDLSSTGSCDAMYIEGRRSYIVRLDNNICVNIDCVAMHEREGGYWYITIDDKKHREHTLQVKMCDIVNPKLRRNGDIGADKAGSFEPSPAETNLETYTLKVTTTALVTTTTTPHHTLSLSKSKDSELEAYRESRDYFKKLSERIFFSTPDAMLNTLGSTLTLAADGAWDGSTWLHGAIGWRMPLAGWRAGYLGDVLGWNDRAISHFDAYAHSQVIDVPAVIPSPTQDASMNLARAEKKWGTQMYSNGYICRNPNRNDQMHHYDMNLNYIDELLWHFEYDADTIYMRKMWKVITSHLAWEKRNFDADNNHLYDAYCCIWASDALYYNGGEVTHSSAYNYRGNLLAAKIARMIGEDPTPYQQEADAILRAMNDNLWVGHWAEYKDVMGLKRVHPNAALWSIYTPIDCGVGDSKQMYSTTKYVDEHIPHIAVEEQKADGTVKSHGDIVSTSDWMPYSWSINNVASAEIMHTALAYFEAGRAKEGLNLVKANITDQMFLGSSPGNLGQISYYDAARGESYRDFGDNIGISARAIIQGVFGIVPNALDGKCILRPGFPLSWDSLTVKTPYLSYHYKRVGEQGRLTISQHFSQPLQIIVRINGEQGEYTDYAGIDAEEQTITFIIPKDAETNGIAIAENNEDKAAEPKLDFTDEYAGYRSEPIEMQYNANVTDIFKNEYLTPRPMSTSLELPIQGIGEWCHPKFTVEINDSVFRSLAQNNTFTAEGITFSTPQVGKNILFSSLWDNYPDSVKIFLSKPKRAEAASFLLCGSTNHMQFGIDNAIIIAQYTDGTKDTLRLLPPYNFCPIEQDYYTDGKAFRGTSNPPLRVSLSTGITSRRLGERMHVPATEVYGRQLTGGAAVIVTMPLQPKKKVKAFTMHTLSNDDVIGIMAVTLRNY